MNPIGVTREKIYNKYLSWPTFWVVQRANKIT